jgi:hypothetical protein
MTTQTIRATLFGSLSAAILTLAPAFAQDARPVLPLPPQTVSTIPSNGDVNPYGVAFVPDTFPTDGLAQPADILVSNFNNNENLQGTGTTIIRIDAHGKSSLFFQGQKGLGLTAALGVLRAGIVIVGNLPTTDGTSNTIKPGSLLFIDRNGNLLGTLANTAIVNGPWGMAIRDAGNAAQIFLSNVLAGTVVRLDLAISQNGIELVRAVQIGSGYNHRTDPAALVLGPSGLFYDAGHDLLYVASSSDNAVYFIPDAGSRTNASGTQNLVLQDLVHLHGPLDISMASNGDLLVANSDGSNADPNQPSELVEFSPDGKFVAQYSLDPNNGGAFGLASAAISRTAIRVAAVNDNQNTITSWTVN